MHQQLFIYVVFTQIYLFIQLTQIKHMSSVQPRFCWKEKDKIEVHALKDEEV